MTRLLQKLSLIIGLSLFSILPIKGQFWELLLDPIFVDGIYYAVVASPDEPTWRETTFASFPYDYPEAGLYLPLSLVGDQTRFHAVAHFQNNERRTSGGFAQFKYSPISMLTMEVSYLGLIDRDNVESSNIGFTSFNISYNRVRHERIHFWWGLGGIFFNESEDTIDDKNSFVVNLGANFYFKRPLSLYAETQLGEINDNFGALSQVRIQVHLSRYLLYAGYQDINFGDLEYGSVTIGGGVYF